MPKPIQFAFDACLAIAGVLGLIHGIQMLQDDPRAVIAIIAGAFLIGGAIYFFVQDLRR